MSHVITSRTDQYRQGYRAAWREAIKFIHAEADRMNDWHARMVLNNVAFSLGCRKRYDRHGIETIEQVSKLFHEGDDSPAPIAALGKEGYKLPSGRPKLPQHAIDRLRDRLRSGESLALMDRLTAMYFLNESEGWPEPEPAEVARLDAIMDEAIKSAAPRYGEPSG